MPLALSDRAIISISGPQAKSFLQGLITNDTRKLAPVVPLYAALLTPQGKILFDFLLFDRDGDVLLDCCAQAAAGLLKRLTMYRLRAPIELAVRSDLTSLWSIDTLPDGAPDPRSSELGWRGIDAMPLADGAPQYRALRLSLGVPEAEDFGSDKIFALDAGLEELHGVSFDKGCYVGQELTARMKHRGTARKRLLLVETADGRHLPAPGTGIRGGELPLGEVVSVYGRTGFALVRLDRWREAGGVAALAGEIPVRIAQPRWLPTNDG